MIGSVMKGKRYRLPLTIKRCTIDLMGTSLKDLNILIHQGIIAHKKILWVYL
jgi:hypothetical protein